MVGGRRGGPHIVQLLPQDRVCDVVHQCHGIQQLILLHISLTQGAVQLNGSLILDGIGQGDLRLGVVAPGLVLVGQLDGHILIPSGIFVCHVVEPRGQAGVAVQILIAGLAEQAVPGESRS